MTGTDDMTDGSTRADDGAPVAEDVEDASSSRSRRWPLAALVVALVGLAVGSLAWGLGQRSDADEARDRIDRQREAFLAASGFVEALMSYDHEDLDAQQAAVERFATGEFRDEFADAFSSEVRQQILAEEASSTVTVQDVYVTVDDGDELTAIVHARSVVSSGRGASAELESYLRIRLVRLGGRWLVDDLTSLGSRDLSQPLEVPPASDAGREDAVDDEGDEDGEDGADAEEGS